MAQPQNRKQDIYEEKTSAFVSILLELNRPFKFSERKGEGTVTDPYYRTVEYMANEDDIKRIKHFSKILNEVQINMLNRLYYS